MSEEKIDWRKTASVICIGAGAILAALGNYFGAELDLSGLMLGIVNAVSGILAGFGIGGVATKQ